MNATIPEFVYRYSAENADDKLTLYKIRVLGTYGAEHIKVSRCEGSEHRQRLVAPGHVGSYVYATPLEAATAYNEALDRMEESCRRKLERLACLRDQLKQLR